jgi:predicted acylesterase/phospholipase RssA
VTYRVRTRDEHLHRNGPKRILALDGGGLRGILTLGILSGVEAELRRRHGDDEAFRLCHYFDLIAGTSTGAIIAAALAIGMSVDEISRKYFALGARVFQHNLLRQGFLRARFDQECLADELRSVFGATTTLGSDTLLTGLLVTIKRLDSGSPWPVSNNPRGQFFHSKPGGTIGNGDYMLWEAVRASTAAPNYFDPERITIAQRAGHPPIEGDFVDGGVSPFNNPALQAFMYATISGYRLNWPAGKDNLLLISVGTGATDSKVRRSEVAAAHAVRALVSLMDDCAALQETMLQWMSQSPTARAIDSELGDLRGDLLAAAPLLSYVRYNASLRADDLRQLLAGDSDAIDAESLSAMDAPRNMEALHRIGIAAGGRDIAPDHFPTIFDLY